MNIKIAQVHSTSDILEKGTIYVRDNADGNPYPVRYTSPFLGKSEGGLISLPPDNAIVLICQPINSQAWYYLGTTADISLSEKFNPLDKPVSRGVLSDRDLYRADGTPKRISLKDDNGNGLLIANEGSSKLNNFVVSLESATGKAVRLVDTPAVDSVYIENEHGDGVKITSNAVPCATMGGRCIQIECLGNVDVISRNGTMNLTVVDGIELNIENKSTGMNGLGPGDTRPGNINITSTFGDVNVTSLATEGAVVVQTVGAASKIALQSAGTVEIFGNQGVSILSPTGNVDIQGVIINLN